MGFPVSIGDLQGLMRESVRPFGKFATAAEMSPEGEPEGLSYLFSGTCKVR